EALSFYTQNRDHLVALVNVQYLEPEDALPPKVLQVLNSHLALRAENQAHINQFISEQEKDYSLKSSDEMLHQFRAVDLEEACKRTEKITTNIKLEFELGKHIMPTYPVPDGQSSSQYLKALCEEALEQRVKEVTEEYVQRL